MRRRRRRLRSNSPTRVRQPAVYPDYHALIREADIDAVDICLPHHLHADAILAAVAAGKHILCEKPMCISLAEADQIVDAVDRAGIVYMSGHNELFYPAIAGAKEAIDRGALGTPFILRSHEFPTGYPAPQCRSPARSDGDGRLAGEPRDDGRRRADRQGLPPDLHPAAHGRRASRSR